MALSEKRKIRKQNCQEKKISSYNLLSNPAIEPGIFEMLINNTCFPQKNIHIFYDCVDENVTHFRCRTNLLYVPLLTRTHNLFPRIQEVSQVITSTWSTWQSFCDLMDEFTQ